MDLIPLVGVGAIRFGDSVESVTRSVGAPRESTDHPEPEVSCSLTYDGFTLGFGPSRSLTFIAVTDASVVPILWGCNPFEIANSASEPAEAIRDWLNKDNRLNETFSDSFGGSVTVPDQNVTFCFPLPDWDYLEGVQLYLHPKQNKGSDA